MTPKKQSAAAKRFVATWQGHGYERGETSKFWIDLLVNVFEVKDFANYIYFEKQIKNLFQNKTITNFIDAYIPQTRVMIEQKSSNKDLCEPIKQSDGSMLTPIQQAKKYIPELPVSQHPKWIITCNFDEFLVYDMEKPYDEPEQIYLKDLEKEYYRLSFLVEETNVHIQKEKELSFKSGELVGLLYDKLREQYGEVTEEDLKHLNKLCVRLVFCLYAEDAGIFGRKSMFGDYLKPIGYADLRDALLKLFTILDQPEEKRSKFEKPELLAFPYVNGGLFSDAKLDEIPPLTEDIKQLLVEKASENFDWSEISPTIFGSLFESTLNPETRHDGGMHYTSIENIHKVIDPLFMNQLNSEYQSAITKAANKRIQELRNLQEKMGRLHFLDPACGSGNFLTETYLSLRRLENKILKEISGGIGYLDLGDIIKVNINQFYGIEINDFAVSVAQTALWIAESQMLHETESIVNQTIEFLPLKSNSNIVEGNALRMDWNSVCPNESLSYIIGNPPFVGAREMENGGTQKQDLDIVFGSKWKHGDIDYVSGWYVKCAEMMLKNNNIKSALVSTNSITQGMQVSTLWEPLVKNYNVGIDFAYRTFRWDNGAKGEAHVHCVIIGFSNKPQTKTAKQIFNTDGSVEEAKNIHPYLIDFPNVFLPNRTEPICGVPEMIFGSTPNDGRGKLSKFSSEEKNEIVKKYPKAEKLFKKCLGADEFIYKNERWCLWLKNINPTDYYDIKPITDMIESVRKVRGKSKRSSTQKDASVPMLFSEIRQPENGTYLLIPAHSSENRKYIPIGYESANVISTNANLLIPNATKFYLGVLTSIVHMAWMRVVCGRLESRYRYSAGIVYNNFPWPKATDAQKAEIERTAQAILDVREKYSDCTYADMYGEKMYLFSDLVAAHEANDKAVLAAYGWPKNLCENEFEIVTRLFKLYEKQTTEQTKSESRDQKKKK